ncbi:MAG TPA: pre-peptidase, partial [Isosphaeraceae bacterium]|nr:pre-peptidase [Isosphaeraceae bacterium]
KATHVKDLTYRVVSAPDVPLGHHDLRAVGAYGISNPRAFVVGDRPESVEVEPNNTPEKANVILVNTVVIGELNGSADVDYFAFEGRQGQRLFLDLEAERIDSRLDATIRVLSPDGTELGESRDVFGADPFLDVILPATARYVIKVHDAIYAGSPDHVYRLTVHDGPHLDAILPLAAQPGALTTFTLIGRGMGASATLDPSLKAEGRVLERLDVSMIVRPDAELTPGSLNPTGMFVPSAGAATRQGFEYTYVRINPTGAAPVVSNRLFVARAAGPVILEHEPNHDGAHAQMVVPPCDISGTFNPPGDVDLYRFQGRKGEVWWIEAFAERIGSLADPAFVIQKVGVQGQPAQDLASGDDLPDSGLGPRFNTQTVDAALRWQVPDDGLYQVLISDLYASQRGHPPLMYRLVIRHEQPDFALVLLPNNPAATDAVTIQAGGRTAAYVGLIRKDGFGGPIRVEARDLPLGVRAEPVTIGPGQVLAPIVFEAAEGSKATVGNATLVGLSRFGDRKETLGYVPGLASLGPALVHEALAGGMTSPPNPAAAVVAPARVVHGFAMAVRAEPAPLSLSARTESPVVAQGHQLKVQLDLARRAGFVEAVAVTATDLPPNMLTGTVSIAKDAKAGVLPLFVPKTVPPGVYTFAIRGTGAYPFSKDANAKQKPNINLTEPANPITLTVRPAPVSVAVDNKGGVLKQAGSLEIGVTIVRQNNFAGPISLSLISPGNLKLAAEPVVVPESQTQTKLVIRTAKDSPPGATASVFVRAAVTLRGEVVEVDEPVGLTINK